MQITKSDAQIKILEYLPGIYWKQLENFVWSYAILLLWRIASIYEPMSISFEVNYDSNLSEFKFVSVTVK